MLAVLPEPLTEGLHLRIISDGGQYTHEKCFAIVRWHSLIYDMSM